MKYVNVETGEILNLAEYRHLQACIAKQRAPRKPRRQWSRKQQEAIGHLLLLGGGLGLALIVINVAWH